MKLNSGWAYFIAVGVFVAACGAEKSDTIEACDADSSEIDEFMIPEGSSEYWLCDFEPVGQSLMFALYDDGVGTNGPGLSVAPWGVNLSYEIYASQCAIDLEDEIGRSARIKDIEVSGERASFVLFNDPHLPYWAPEYIGTTVTADCVLED